MEISIYDKNFGMELQLLVEKYMGITKGKMLCQRIQIDAKGEKNDK